MFSSGKEVLLFLSIFQFITPSIMKLAQARLLKGGRSSERPLTFSVLNKKIIALSERISALEEHEHLYHDHHAVIFAATRSLGNIDRVGEPIVYDKVNLNRQQGYNSTTGIFTCPLPGVYFFTYSTLTVQGEKASVALVKNSNKLSKIHSALSAQHSERSELTLLETGDRVFVQLEIGSLLSLAGSLKFQGYLVSD